ncbi:biotin-dependent carboxyltransferase family protein [Lentibacillus sp. N15]|uniref:5-oxoprolinase subunit C family protein n=1 Tax=Lentibacillus songyuanensis TaxID=3136161 RepID=UPI0031B9ADE2
MTNQNIFTVHKSGVLTTMQDMGRKGYQRFGVPVAGAMDTYALQIANILVGNKRDEVCLEVTLIGPELEARQPVTMAITGAAINPAVNGQSIPMWESFVMQKGDRLTFGSYQAGVRCYIAAAGGFVTPTMFGSKSTDMNSGFGRVLIKGETLVGNPAITCCGIGLMKTMVPSYQKEIDVAVIEGPHANLFTEADRQRFYQTTFTVGANSNRMGYRLTADDFHMSATGDVWSDATPFGGIQIPPNGQPIILMADRQTTGGYPRIGTVISTELSNIAQLPPQGKIRFYPISVEEAQQQRIDMEAFLDRLELFRAGLVVGK